MKISTGFKSFDKCTEGGIECPSLIALGGRPGMGKTFFLLTLCLNWEEQKIPYMFISLELSKKQMNKRTDNQIPEQYLWDSKDFANVDVLCEFIADTSKSVKIFVIDYIQLLPKGKYPEPYIEMSEIMNKLKLCSIRNDVCIIISSQLSRKVEDRPRSRPYLYDFRDSGVIEESSDLVLLLYRRDYYDSNDRPNEAEIIVAKNRFGNTASFRLLFDRKEGDYFDHPDDDIKKYPKEDEEPFSNFSI